MASVNTPWPPPSEFNRMLQNPRMAFKLPRLQECAIDKDVNGQPTVRAGAFAAVYKGTYPSGENVCLRVFTSKAEDRRERYAAISDYVCRQKLKYLVDFEYHESAIRHPSGKWYPLVTMQWVEGNVLFDWLRERCLTHDARALKQAAEQWVELVGSLAHSRIAHGDLQHNNIMVTLAGELKLVDYDGMCVPAIEGRVNLELGVEPYQHPERGPDTKLFPGIDNFSALFILVGLRALAAEPRLWSTFIEPPGGELYDKLLFRTSDFESPQQSALIQELRRSPDSKVGTLVEELIRQRQVPLQSVPQLSHFANDFDAIRKLLRQHDWDAAVALLDRNSHAQLPADLAAGANDARARIKCYEEMTAAVNAGDEQAMQRLFNSALLKNYAKAQPLLDAARAASEVVPVLKKLEQTRQTKDWRTLAATWDGQQKLLQNRRSAEKFRGEVAAARQRNAACDEVLSLLENPLVDAETLETAWQALRALGGHPDADRRADEITNSVNRKRAFNKLQHLPDTLKEHVDQKLVDQWNEAEFKDLAGADDLRRRHAEAKARLENVRALRDAIQQAGSLPTMECERNIYEAAIKLPPGYAVEGDAFERVQTTIRRLKSHRKCNKLLAAENSSEDDLAAAWQSLVEVHGEPLLNGAQRRRLELAVHRVPVLAKLAKISLSTTPSAQHDQELLKVWNADLLRDCRAAEPWRAAHDLAVQRRSRLAELRRVIDADDDFAIAACLDALCFKKFDFSPDIKERLLKTKQCVQGVTKLIDTLHSGQKAQFVELFDQDVVRKFSGRFAPYRARLTDWVKTEILPRQKMGLKEPQLEKCMMASPGKVGRWQFRWTWPPRRFANECLLAFCRALPTGRTNPDEIAGHRIRIDRRQWESAGAYYDIKPQPEWGHYIAVWAEVDLGFERLFSEPLVLGRLGN